MRLRVQIGKLGRRRNNAGSLLPQVLITYSLKAAPLTSLGSSTRSILTWIERYREIVRGNSTTLSLLRLYDHEAAPLMEWEISRNGKPTMFRISNELDWEAPWCIFTSNFRGT
jgi:hypothetical protein